MKRTGDLTHRVAGGKARFGTLILLSQFRPMRREPQLLGTLLEGGDLGFGEAETAGSGACLRHPVVSCVLFEKIRVAHAAARPG